MARQKAQKAQKASSKTPNAGPALAQRQRAASEQEAGSRQERNGEAGEVAIPQFFNTTFSAHRVSPLYIGAQPLDQARLDRLAHRLRDTLVGDVVRGVQIGLEATDTPMGQVGPLKAVNFRWFRAADVLGDKISEDWGEPSEERMKGLWVEMQHENAAYVALLLPGFSHPPKGSGTSTASLWNMGLDNPGMGEADRSQFLHLPLLLLRMPQPLKAVIGEWLSTTFDCRVTKLNLGTRTLVGLLEGWIQETGLPRADSGLVLTLAFNAPLTDKGREAVLDLDGDPDGDDEGGGEAAEPGLRTMEISISASDLRRFLRAGKALQKSNQATASTVSSTASWEHDDRERRRLAGPHTDDGWGWLKSKERPAYPLMEALANHLNHHMALNLFHPSVRVTQVSCGGFVLSQSRIKIVKAGDVTEALSRAAWMFVTLLAERVQSGGMPLVT
ncbi:siroheme synthase [Trichoderma cornu-damae]|uniref:Siroheme synthase n=1 Tax=Trichoderma cornu-damae TaxID=654480 RepID=A0A9P8QP76_9HYPO|nr:siroheme synthase [Trichoderma cornu-damae]